MKIIKYIFIFLSVIIINLNILYAEENKVKIENFLKLETKNIALDNALTIDLRELEEELKKEEKSDISFEWDITGDNTKFGSVFEKKFETFGEKEINLSIYKNSGINKELVKNHRYDIFIYKNKIVQISEENLSNKINSFITKAKESGIYIDSKIINSYQIEKFNFKENLINKLEGNNYLVVWGSKDFIFDVLSKINTEKIENKINLSLVSSFNINILQKILNNFISNKLWINNAILIDESSKYELFKQASDIELLKYEIKKNNYEYIDLNSKSKIYDYLFISKFTNNLSNFGFSTLNIYLILIIPFLLLGVSVFKHIIGLSPTGILIPVTITLLFLKFSFIATIILIGVFLVTNLTLSKIITKYNLHYTPKITLLTLINIIIFIITINIFISYKIVNININDIMFIIFFILIAEKLINVITSKEFLEYRGSLINTLIFAISGYIFFSIKIIKTFILAYPEIIILIIPIIFIIGKFSGLRVTEYFRFKETIKSIEEE